MSFFIDSYEKNSDLNEELLAKDSLLSVSLPTDNLNLPTNAPVVLPVDIPLGAPSTIGGSPRATTLVYQMTGGGILNFGDGSDGNVIISVDTTLTADKYYKNLIVNAGVTLNPGGYRIFVSEVAHVYGTVTRNGNNGASTITSTGGAGGAALADGYLKGSVAGGNGGNGDAGAGGATGGENGGDTSNSIGVNGAAGGNGGTADTAGGSGGTAGTATASNVKFIANWHLATLLDVGVTGATVKFDNSAGSGGGAGGGRDTSAPPGNGAGGGGAGSAGGIIAIYAKRFIIYSEGVISANGGNGGNGGDGIDNDGGAGGGGAGGSGGCVVLVYNSLSNNGSITANGGTKGVKGTGGTGATDGTDGNAGAIYQFEVSL